MIELINQTGGIPIRMTAEATTNWPQFTLSLVIGSIFILFFMYGIMKDKLSGGVAKLYLSALKKKTGRHVLMIKHTEIAMFGGSMIDQGTLRKINMALQKFKGKPFDLVLHTPGGEIFSAQFISRLLKEYPGHVRALIPMYAMSGGTFLALSCDEVGMSPTSCLGPVDPQLGNLFRFGSAKAWDKIIKFKGKKAEDQSVSFALMGKQYTKSIKECLMDNIKLDMKPKDKKKFVDYLVNGEIEHAHPLLLSDLNGMGVPVGQIIETKVLKILNKLVSKHGLEGVSYL